MSTDVAVVRTACGAIPVSDPTPGDGNCATNLIGAFCDNVPSGTLICNTTTCPPGGVVYSTTGTYSAKVIVFSGIYVEARTPVTVGAGARANLVPRNFTRNPSGTVTQGQPVTFRGEVVNQ